MWELLLVPVIDGTRLEAVMNFLHYASIAMIDILNVH